MTGRLVHQAGLLVAMALLMAACEVPTNAITIINRLDHNVRVFQQRGNSTSVVHERLRSGVKTQLREECVVDLVAISSVTNEEVDRRPGPLCRGDDPWIIDQTPG